MTGSKLHRNFEPRFVDLTGHCLFGIGRCHALEAFLKNIAWISFVRILEQQAEEATSSHGEDLVQ